MSITLRDIDNRDGDGAPYEFTGTAEDICGYLDGPLRSDLVGDHAQRLDNAMRAVRSGDVSGASDLLRPLSVHLVSEADR